ncbi:hypothetical protein DM48_316 [Burkholderia gladioli]|uniref:Phage ABA sandwich domain-containing protein n=1 Tax=Burkholderia gladioli TaxID=28095 RepID=A0AAW3F2L5_BURGA|nr:hypothetical protein [Burkholderia gladioli]KGC15179.1 hypothetical protein DM48_316 [Burkholderia gladioli]
MNDQELLRLAAKAAGAEWTDYQRGTPNHWHIERADGVWREWNPLNDDGDALRLAVHLRLMVHASSHSSSAQFYEMNGWATIEEPHGDANAATRRAITRAAAEIGARITEAGGGA